MSFERNILEFTSLKNENRNLEVKIRELEIKVESFMRKQESDANTLKFDFHFWGMMLFFVTLIINLSLASKIKTSKIASSSKESTTSN